MGSLTKIAQGRYEIVFPANLEVPIEPSVLMDGFLNAPILESKGRGGIRILNVEGRPVACRKYVHGGLLRGLTRDIFFTEKRAIDEFEIILYLKRKGFPIVDPCFVIVENHRFTTSLYILTYYEENAADLLDFLAAAKPMERLRAIKRLAELMWRLQELGVYHPDLHLNNVLITVDKKTLEAEAEIPPRPPFVKGGWRDFRMIFLDLDRACRKKIGAKDMERMFWRLNRYVDKMEREGKLAIEAKEKLLFLRAYGRLSGSDMTRHMAAKVNRKSLLYRLGWFFEGLFYRGQNDSKLKTQNSKLRK